MGVEPSDAWLIEESLVEPSVFDSVFHRHHVEVFSFLARAVGSSSAGDLTQQVFLEAFAHRRAFRGNGSARPWLFGIARNVLKRWYRTERRWRRATHRLGFGTSSVVEYTEDSDERVFAEGMRGELRMALMALPQRQRDAFLLFALGGLSYAEVSAALNIPVGTVRSRIHRARARIRTVLESAPIVDVDGHRNTDG